MTNRLRQLIVLPTSRKILFGQAWVLLIFCQICVNHLPLASLMKMFRLRIVAPAKQPLLQPLQKEIGEIEWAISSASRHICLLRTHCLAKALTTRILLGRRTIACRLVLGASFAGTSELKAHAWIKTDCGQLLNCGCTPSDFASLTEFV